MAMPISSSQGGSNNRSNQSAGSDAAGTEKLRIEHMKQERERAERERAKGELQTKTQKLAFNKKVILQHQSDLRRVEAESSQLQNQVRGTESSTRGLEGNIIKERQKLTHIKSDLQKAKSELEHMTVEYNKETMVVEKLEHDKQATEKKTSTSDSASHSIDVRKQHHVDELRKLEAENTRLEQDIRALEIKAR